MFIFQNFGKISVKLSVLGSYTLIIALMGVKFGTPLCQLSLPLVQRVATEAKTSQLPYQHFALHTLVLVNGMGIITTGNEMGRLHQKLWWMCKG